MTVSIFLMIATGLVPVLEGRGNCTVAGEFNPTRNIGDDAPAWSDLIGVDDQMHALSDLQDKSVVVVVFTCNSCPYAVDLEDRLVELSQQLQANNAAIVAINVNQVEEDGLPAMKSKAESKQFKFAYLFDPTQKIARQFGAGYTPECFVLDGQRKIAYMGSFDDSPNGRNIQKTYVHDAIEAVLAGRQPTVTETVPIGCRIRYERERRTRRPKAE
ncbi:thioredoxin family protein [Neorhodopirellula pilleata]|uniref:AhpC/TSA family protein n=1 Tax=Neorhodopirellula pilleata TaxID=2714738 RepID=A0A5C5ZY39_9BACT|nr:thioredoxin family protein [Neorhodopirellula pilleata]TWT92582.1 AhpC/TSA family protein [Neorhodopirellula pilleata]